VHFFEFLSIFFQVFLHQQITSTKDIDSCVEAYENAYSNETGESLPIVWHAFHKEQLIKVHRILSQEIRLVGNAIFKFFGTSLRRE